MEGRVKWGGPLTDDVILFQHFSFYLRSRAELSGVEKFHFLQPIGKELFIHLNWSVLTWVRRLEEEEELKVEKVKQIFFFF
jgi:hypothetical protein